MKCPYCVNTVQVVQTRNEFNESGCTTFSEEKSLLHRKFVSCLKEDCGAWQNGRCNYNQGANG